MIDAHFHIWRPARGDYGWLTPALGALHRDVAIADWRREAAPCGVTGGILVQAAPTEAETRFLLDAAAAEPGAPVLASWVLGVVGWVDLTAADAPHRVAEAARAPRLKGLRPMLQDIADPEWILASAVAPGLAAMAAHGLTFDALVRPVHLPRIRTLAARHPDLTIVIDHGAKPDIAGDAFAPWADEIERIARDTQAFCKLSGLLTEAGSSPERLPRYIAHLAACFGPERLIWGSDWPVLELAGNYRDWHALALNLVPAADRDAVFGGNARRAYRLD
ncbi:hydrolase [Aliidongia dinghuensis]|uniref:Hydrolase n=1 Tax=Aliidongia dinghuensis TaxID=1867774 RepID=A0A8J2YZA3_9PROT|nr:amidohydrolase family protein [Aliidongia dinghuensis]GGF44559.1 hydrolase [Aliidongia dinghuensis]